jgi:hypothetical protein
MCLFSKLTSRIALGSLLLVLVYICGACSAASNQYVERHRLENLTVVFLDEESLWQEWQAVANKQAVRFTSQMKNSVPVVKTVRGFYNYATNTVYCPKWNFEVCGHELHHAALGQFHGTE